MGDTAAIAKASKESHTAQIQRLAAKNQDELLLLEEMRDYLKRRSDIESAYQDQLSKLATSVLANRKRVVKPGPDGKDKDDRKNTLKAWISLLEETRNQAKIRGTFADKLRDQFTTPMKPYIAEKARLFTKYSEYALRVQTDLHVGYQELARVKQLYDQCAKEEERAKAKYDEAMKPVTGTLRKAFGAAVTTEKLEQVRKRHKAAARKASDAKNEYILVLEASNSHQNYYHRVVLPQLMRNMDGVYYDSIRRYITDFGELESANARDSLACMAAVITAASRINRDIESDEFVTECGPVFGDPKTFQPELLGKGTRGGGAGQTPDITVDEMSKVLLSNKLDQLQARVAKLNQAIEKKDKEAEALRRMSSVYDNNPSFGKASDTKDEEDNLMHARDIMALEKVKLEAQIAVLTKAGVEVLAPAVKKVKKDKDDSKRAKLTCVALYDYTANDQEELSFRTDDVITIVDDRPDWLLGELNGQQGLVPVTYVAKRNSPPSSDAIGISTTTSNSTFSRASAGPAKAIALYSYKGNEQDGEISFQAGDVIEIINRTSPDDPDFWEGRVNGKVGFFPSMFVDAQDDDDSLSEIGTMRRSGSSSTVNSVTSQSAPEPTGVGVHAAAPARGVQGLTAVAPAPAPVLAPTAAAAPPASQSFYVIALYDYDTTISGELPFKTGEKIQVISKNTGDDQWWEGQSASGKVGQFPRAYVDETPVAAPAPAIAAKPRPPVATAQPAVAPATTLAKSGTLRGAPPKVASKPPAKPALPKAVVAYEYDARSAEELTIRPGDALEIVSMEVPDDPDHAWWMARLRGKEGLIPKDYVTLQQ